MNFHPKECVVRYVDITYALPFAPLNRMIKLGEEDKFWKEIHAPRSPGMRMRALFLDRPSGSVLQMLGTRYAKQVHFLNILTLFCT